MRKIFGLLAGAAFVASLMTPITAQQMTIKGEIVDVACATKKGEGGRGPDHAGCAMACAKKGMAVGVMTTDAIYTITGDYAANNNAKLLDFVAKNVEVMGTVSEKDGQKMINITSIKAVM